MKKWKGLLAQRHIQKGTHTFFIYNMKRTHANDPWFDLRICLNWWNLTNKCKEKVIYSKTRQEPNKLIYFIFWTELNTDLTFFAININTVKQIKKRFNLTFTVIVDLTLTHSKLAKCYFLSLFCIWKSCD